MTANEFRDELAALLTKAMEEGIPIDELIGALAITQTMCITQYMIIENDVRGELN